MDRENTLSEPIYLIDNFCMQEFSTAALSAYYLLTIGDRHYKISRPLFFLIEIIKQHHTIEEIAHAFSQKVSQPLSSDEITDFINKELAFTGIIKDQPYEIKKKDSYLLLKFGLFSEKTLQPVTSILKTLFTPNVVKPLVFLILFSHYYAIVNFWSTTSVFNFAEQPYTLVVTVCLLLVSVILHELGHVSACRYYGVNHKEIGFGLYMHIAIFYSNITDCWRLPSLQRAVVDIAGAYFQLIFNLFLILAFCITNQHVFINVIQLCCIQLLFSLNPFLRYDGYWLATDLLGIPNLRKKSRELVKFAFQNFKKKAPNSKSFFHEIQPFRKYLFFVYAIVSNLFLSIFICFVFTRLPNLLSEFKIIIFELKESLSHSITWEDILMNIYKFSIHAIPLVLISFFGYKLIKSGLSSLKKIKATIKKSK